MAKAHSTGMQGVYLVAAELTKRGLTVAPTSRSAVGADLLVTDERCKKAWSVQVKTNYGRPRFWLLNKNSGKVRITQPHLRAGEPQSSQSASADFAPGVLRGAEPGDRKAHADHHQKDRSHFLFHSDCQH